METRFQTSFIPKKPIPMTAAGISSSASNISRRSSGGTNSIFMTIATIVFVVSLLGVGGVYGWKQYLISQQENYKKELNTSKGQFDLPKIAFLKVQSTKIDLARNLLMKHMITSKIFSFISLMTAQNVRFTSMQLGTPTGTGGEFSLALTGYGRDFTTVAFQASVLNKLEGLGLNTIIKNPIVSNPVLNQNGTVSFGLSATIDSSSFLTTEVPTAVPTATVGEPSTP